MSTELNTVKVAALPPAQSPFGCLRHHQSHCPCSRANMSSCEWEFIYWPFKRTLGFLAAFHLMWMHGGIPIDFQGQMLSGILFLALVSWAGEPGMVLRPLTPQGKTSEDGISLWMLTHHILLWGYVVLCHCPSYLSTWLLLYILSYRTFLFSWSSHAYPGWSFYSLVVILLYSCEEVNTASTYSAILTGTSGGFS